MNTICCKFIKRDGKQCKRIILNKTNKFNFCWQHFDLICRKGPKKNIKKNLIQYREMFEPIQILGKGKFGTVYTSKDKTSNDIIVVKKIIKNPKFVQIIRTELTILKKLKEYCSKYILCYKGAFEDNSNVYIITEYLKDYVPLSKIKSLFELKTQEEHRLIYTIIINLYMGLRLIHEQNVAHNDIKTDNVLAYDVIDEKSVHFGNIKYIDFGCAFENADRRILRPPCFTINYVAKEIYYYRKKKDKFDLKELQYGDIWSLGIVIYKLITGKTPAQIAIQEKLVNSHNKEEWYNYFNYLNKDGIYVDYDTKIEQILQHVNKFAINVIGYDPHISLKNMLAYDPQSRHL